MEKVNEEVRVEIDGLINPIRYRKGGKVLNPLIDFPALPKRITTQWVLEIIADTAHYSRFLQRGTVLWELDVAMHSAISINCAEHLNHMYEAIKEGNYIFDKDKRCIRVDDMYILEPQYRYKKFWIEEEAN